MLKHSILEGIKNAIRSVWLSLTAIVVLTVSLFSVVFIVSLSTTITFAVRNLDSLISVPAFLKEDVAEEDIPDLLTQLEALPKVKEVEYFDREKAEQELEQDKNGFDITFIREQTELDENLLLRFILVTPIDSPSYDEVVSQLNSEQFSDKWEEVAATKEFVDRLINFGHNIRIFGFILILVFATISILVMVNILRITIYSNRAEIEIMRLVGATNNYIRGPFVIQGIFYYVLASAIVLFVFIPLLNTSLPAIETIFGANFQDGGYLFQIYLMIASAISVGIIVSVVTTYLATERYLQL